MPPLIDSKSVQHGNMNFPMMYKYQIFDYLEGKTDLITAYFGPRYGPP